MAVVPYPIEARAAGQPATGLKPTWTFLKSLPDLTDLTPPPITEVGHGLYLALYDPALSGEACGQVDLGSVVTDPAERYVFISMYKADSVDAVAAAVLAALGAVLIAPGHVKGG